MKQTEQEFIFWSLIATTVSGLVIGLSIGTKLITHNFLAFTAFLIALSVSVYMITEYPKQFSSQREIETQAIPESLASFNRTSNKNEENPE